jgi:hypothetical protein
MWYNFIVNKYNLRFTVLCLAAITFLFILSNQSLILISAQQPPTTGESLKSIKNQTMQESNEAHLGVNMRGYYTSMPQSRDFKFPFPDNYYDTSFKELSKANIIDHVRYRYYWES